MEIETMSWVGLTGWSVEVETIVDFCLDEMMGCRSKKIIGKRKFHPREQ